MPIAGCLGDSPELKRATESSLRRMQFKEGSETTVQECGSAILGAVADGKSFAGDDNLLPVDVVFDGRLFEGRELRAALELPADCNEAAIAASAYVAWGAEFPDRLDGEYAFALWDRRQKRLVLGRDAMSRVSLFYSRPESGLCFASEPMGLMGWNGVDTSLNERAVAMALSLTPPEPQEELPTLQKGIFSLRGGHVMLIGSDRAESMIDFWQPLKVPQLVVKDWREYGDALRAALLRAVRVRLPVEGLVASQLSSGFDSSGVTALTAQVLARQNRPLIAYTSVPAHSVNAKEIMGDRFSNEWPLAAQVAAMYPNVEHVAVPTDAVDWWESLDVMGDNCGAPAGFIRNSRWYLGILTDAQRRGAVTMMEGQAGNLTSSYNGGFGLYDLRSRKQWGLLYRALRNRRKHGGNWKSLLSSTWMPSRNAMARIQRLRRREVPGLFDLSMMRRDFYENSGLAKTEHSAMGATVEGDRTNGAAWRFSILRASEMGMMRSMQRRAFGMEREDPTADRRLVELCLGIPDEAFAPEGIKRELYRHGFRNDLPAELLSEPLRGLQSSDFLQMFEAWIPEWRAELDRLDQSALAGMCLDLPRMRKLLDDWPTMVATNRSSADMAYNYTFGGALAMGRFLRRMEERTGQ
ncbi:asparagine synthase-related protein [Terriglobus roseus]|uniref:asparagine synthase (glutamine-hydrolyzing) n=1 Tax=Terriglobus roseus TaxID=392734 RepID=A0A1H4IVT1_9BACT|nr:asparagine synthase-related protein [Terriglobus roseus]SEB37726.1 asparagine synthase (glutamine-hydrolysing) [Terriglobus roseus]